MATTIRYPHIRISEASHRVLRDLSAQSGESMTALLDRAVEQLRRDRLFADAAVAWQAIQADPIARAELDAEYGLWEAASADGLDPEQW
jgi:hypothetical protein